jgi:hypothetical protein
MPANNDPIFPLTPDITWVTAVTAANTAVDGTGTVSTVFTAGANGSWCEEVIFTPLGTNVVTVARLFVNNGGTNATAGNNFMFGQITLPATTLNNAAALFVPRFPVKMALPAGYKINVVLATAVAAGYVIGAVGGDY